MTMQEVRRNYNRPVWLKNGNNMLRYILRGLIERRSEKDGSLSYTAELQDVQNQNSITYAALKDIEENLEEKI